MIQLIDINKVYEMGEHQVHALRNVNLHIDDGEFVAIVGASGSGKSTLMNILGCLDQPTSGTYLLDGVMVSDLDDDELALVRNQAIGFVFQSYNLLPRIPAIKQVELPLVYRGTKDRAAIAYEALRIVGLENRVMHKPKEMSGGEQQRVAIARAIITSPSLLLADEPTGNLDSRTSLEIIALFQALNRERGITVCYVTHEPEIAQNAKRIVQVRDGRIISDITNEHPLRADEELRHLTGFVAPQLAGVGGGGGDSDAGAADGSEWSRSRE
jgi:putative ABC transport system ATP-binding protein